LSHHPIVKLPPKLYVVSGIWRRDKEPYYSVPKHSSREECIYKSLNYDKLVSILRIPQVLMLNQQTLTENNISFYAVAGMTLSAKEIDSGAADLLSTIRPRPGNALDNDLLP
jgi:hypothetical protein